MSKALKAAVGRPKQFQKRITMSFDLDKSLYDWMTKFAEEETKRRGHRVYRSEVLREALESYMEK